MKKSFFLSLLLIASLNAQEGSTLIDPIVKEPTVQTEPAPEPQRLEIPPEDIISSKVIIADGQKFTIQKVQPQDVLPLPPAPTSPDLSPEEQAIRDAARAARHTTVGTFRTLMLSCTVYDGQKTMIRWASQGKAPAEFYTAWSNVNFHYFNSLNRFKKNDTTYTIFFGIGDTDTEHMTRLYARRNANYTPPAIPALPADATTAANFVVTEGNPSPTDLEPIVALHELFEQHHVDFIAEHARLKALREKEAAARAANPPDPKPDIIIRHWTVDPATQASVPNTQTQEGKQ